MGNEGSRFPELEIETPCLEVTDNWSLHFAKDIDDNVYSHSAFIGQQSSLDAVPTPLEKFAKNLMICRHPCIVKYVSSWSKNNKFHLITEQVQPLMLVLPNQSDLQICIGLYNILTAINFLHEKAQSAHNNICCASIYVTPEGIWKLGGLEYLMKFSEITVSFLKQSKNSRYEKAIPPEEDVLVSNSKVNAAAIDKYAFGVMVEELLKKKSSSEIPFLAEFLDYCRKRLKNCNPDERASLLEVLQQPFFNHEFIRISKFLFYLPLKTSSEKEHFFNELTEQLNLLPEDIVACQLTSLLLSRVVLLDCTAQKHLLPALLQPKTDKPNGVGLFSENVFKKYIIPKLFNIFRVRDAQIRIILLNNFDLFCHMFSPEELKSQILPELLVGIKDVNDELVSITLKALSQLVMILGASTVIGGKRGKLFIDGKPKSYTSVIVQSKHKVTSKKKSLHSPLKYSPEVSFTNNSLPERPSPDGGEDKLSSTSNEESEINDIEHWSDWGLPVEKNLEEVFPEKSVDISKNTTEEITVKNVGKKIKKEDSEITFLDIKSTTNESISDGIMDFFHDMEPVISKTQVLSIKPSKTKFDIESDELGCNYEGWEEDWELGEEKIS